MNDWLEVRIPISPRADYFNRIQVIAHSIRSLGGPYADVRVRVTVGADQEPEDLYAHLPWSGAAGVEWVWANRAEFQNWKNTKHEYIATMMERFRPPFSTRHVLMLDADILVMRRFDELRDLLDEKPGVASMMAHVSAAPTPSNRARWRKRLFRLTGIGGSVDLDGRHWWQQLYDLVGAPMPPFVYEHSGWGIVWHDRARRFGPPYFNTGVVLASASILERLYEPYMRALDALRTVADTYFFEQIALTLSLAQTGAPFHVLPLRYNFPNDPEFDKARPDELNEIRFLHFLRTNIVRRELDFETMDTIRAMTARKDLTGSNELLRRRTAELLPSMMVERELAVASGNDR
jgi:hypothetical protein